MIADESNRDDQKAGGSGRRTLAHQRTKLEAYGDDTDSVRAFGLDVVTSLCDRLLSGGAPGLHFYTLNQAGAGTSLPSLSCAVRRPRNQSMTSAAGLLSVGPCTVGQPVEVSVTASWGTVGMRPLGLISSAKTVLGAANMRREGT